ncbi:MAG: hypothetical protein F4148_15150 [Caldilineaceae bacterium SB0675_bin_29]|uniref:CopG-like ribbon-helix-helix domain-containing protein n=1 Tax=Caldilineaceae bacterium SB0675_bin_29 TaxID=2605266 RepID=A0A6B1G3N3_9CHLR|nr:hypothetical protein [Caldilineaceae bacterium SB0675_bin_29]
MRQAGQIADVEAYIKQSTASLSAAPEERLRRLIVQLPDSNYRRFKQLAAEQGVTMSELCRAWVEEALAEHFD